MQEAAYQLEVPVRLELVDAFGERFRVEFDAGKHVPRSEREEIALEHMAVNGTAERVVVVTKTAEGLRKGGDRAEDLAELELEEPTRDEPDLLQPGGEPTDDAPGDQPAEEEAS